MQTNLKEGNMECAKAYGFIPEKMTGDSAQWIQTQMSLGKKIGEWSNGLDLHGSQVNAELKKEASQWDFWKALDYFSEGGLDILVVGNQFVFYPEKAREMLKVLQELSEKTITQSKDYSSEVTGQPFLMNLNGKIMSFQQKYSEAGEYFRKSIDHLSEFAEPYANLGVLLWNGGKRREALYLFSEAFLKNSHRMVIQLNFFDAVHEMKEYDYLVKVMEMVLPQNNSTEFKLHLSIGYRNLGRLDDARNILTEVLKNNPHDEEAKVLLLSLDQPVESGEQTLHS